MPIILSETGLMKQKKPIKRKSIKLPKYLQNLNPYTAGIDIGSKSHFVAVPDLELA